MPSCGLTTEWPMDAEWSIPFYKISRHSQPVNAPI